MKQPDLDDTFMKSTLKNDTMLTGADIVRRDGPPVWKQIEEALAADIGSGRTASGEQLPTEQALAKRFDVNRHTIRRAIAALVERGLVAVRQGSGMFVPHLPLDYAIGPHTRFTTNVTDALRTPDRANVTIERAKADARIAEALGVRKGTIIVRRRGIGLADGQPINLGTTNFPISRLPGINDALEHEPTITRALARVGVTDYVRQSTRIYAAMPTQDEAELLRQSTRRPVLVTEAVDVDSDGTPISFGQTLFAGERVQLTV